ncbi:hypothetical protein QBC45DRAFT_185935 [Copromyces sp. CBS 386.78]|nr:hypothetical protein QBC45DRAFT_185935 [Copromyces sp. CBS 386.78]
MTLQENAVTLSFLCLLYRAKHLAMCTSDPPPVKCISIIDCAVANSNRNPTVPRCPSSHRTRRCAASGLLVAHVVSEANFAVRKQPDHTGHVHPTPSLMLFLHASRAVECNDLFNPKRPRQTLLIRVFAAKYAKRKTDRLELL